LIVNRIPEVIKSCYLMPETEQLWLTKRDGQKFVNRLYKDGSSEAAHMTFFGYDICFVKPKSNQPFENGQLTYDIKSGKYSIFETENPLKVISDLG